MAPDKRRTWYASLEGLRGWAFLVVFVLHYGGAFSDVDTHRNWLYPWFVANQLIWLAVPLFFVLSGFLITGILYDTRQRRGYFRVFYLRRMIRIFPLYYLVLAATAVAAWLLHYNVPLKYWSYPVYLQNFWADRSIYYLGNRIELGHLWSLAVEEQFYLVWPLVVWVCAGRARLMKVCFGVLAFSMALRIAWPLLHLPILFAYYCTFTRMDALILGAMLALYQRTPGCELRALAPLARATVAGGLALMILQTILTGQSLPFDYWGVAVLIPLVNVICAGILVLALDPGTWTNAICSQRWVCQLGRLSYGVYVIHLLYRPWFLEVALPAAARVLGTTAGRGVVMCAALALTLVLASLTYRYVEAPALRWKDKIAYGPAVQSCASDAISPIAELTTTASSISAKTTSGNPVASPARRRSS